MQAAISRLGQVEAIFLYNTSERWATMPRKAFPHPELEKKMKDPIAGIYRSAVEAE